jgi:O-antigen ligase
MLLVLIGGGVFFVSKTAFFKDRLKHAVASGKNIAADTRYELWSAAVKMWRDHVWFGMGPAHFDHRFRAYRPEAVQLQPDRVHNDYLNTLVDWGVAGGAMIAVAVGALWAGLAKTWHHVRRAENEFRTSQSNKFAFVLGSAIGLLALMLHSLVDFNMQVPANAILAISLMALLTSHLRFATERYWVSARLWSRLVASVALLAGLGYLAYQEARLGREYAWLQRARQAEFLSPAQTAARESAFAAEPRNFQTAHAIGEAYWLQNADGGPNWRELTTNAMIWFARGTNLNRYDGYNYMGYGMCLDRLERFDEAEPYFNKADELDPNGYFTMAHVGLHYVATGDYAAARPWFERSLRLQWKSNDLAVAYLEIIKSRLLEAASQKTGPPTGARP